MFVVWPADADLELEVAGDGVAGGALAQLPSLQPEQQDVFGDSDTKPIYDFSCGNI